MDCSPNSRLCIFVPNISKVNGSKTKSPVGFRLFLKRRINVEGRRTANGDYFQVIGCLNFKTIPTF